MNTSLFNKRNPPTHVHRFLLYHQTCYHCIVTLSYHCQVSFWGVDGKLKGGSFLLLYLSLCIPRSFTNHYAEKMLVGAR